MSLQGGAECHGHRHQVRRRGSVGWEGHQRAQGFHGTVLHKAFQARNLVRVEVVLDQREARRLDLIVVRVSMHGVYH